MKKVILILYLSSSILSAQQIETTLEGTGNKTIGLGADLSIPLIYKGVSQLVIGSRVYLSPTRELLYKRSTWNIGHRLEFQKDKYTSAIGFYSGFEYWPSKNIENLDEIRHNVRPLVYLEYTFSKGTNFPEQKKSLKVFIGGSDNELRLGVRLIFNLRRKYLAYY